MFMLFVDVLDMEYPSRMLTSNDIGGIFQFIQNKNQQQFQHSSKSNIQIEVRIRIFMVFLHF